MADEHLLGEVLHPGVVFGVDSGRLVVFFEVAVLAGKNAAFVVDFPFLEADHLVNSVSRLFRCLVDRVLEDVLHDFREYLEVAVL